MTEQSPLETGNAPQYPDIAVLNVTVLHTADPVTKHFFNTDKKAIVLIGSPVGTTPSALNRLISRSVHELAVPVFILPSTTEGEGLHTITYVAQEDAKKAGATFLRGVNMRYRDEVLSDIQGAIAEGKTGQELSLAITDKYGTLAN